jgi:hypothetical protein
MQAVVTPSAPRSRERRPWAPAASAKTMCVATTGPAPALVREPSSVSGDHPHSVARFLVFGAVRAALIRNS